MTLERWGAMLFIFLLALCWRPQKLCAQADTGAISGTVSDSANRVLAGATVTFLHNETGIRIQCATNSGGLYSAPGLRIGKYTLSASSADFTTEVRPDIELRVQDSLRVDFRLVPGQVNTTITVESRSPLLETENASIGQVVDESTMQNLPLRGRNYIQLATLGAGTSPSRRSAERGTFIANGVRAAQNTYLLDGVDNRNKIVGFDNSPAQAIEPVLDAVREFKVQTNLYSAEFGQAAGAVVNVSLKSGANQFHGSMFEYNRNSFFDATPYFQLIGPKPQANQNQFGATSGGPLIKNKTFFFASWQSMRVVSLTPQLAAVPTLTQRKGVFGTVIYDPRSTAPAPNGKGYVRTPFPKNTIPAQAWDPVAAQLMQLYPLPNIALKSNFFSDQKETIADDQFNLRFDHRFREADSFFARASYSTETSTLPGILPPPAGSLTSVWPEAHSFVGSETHIFRSNLINELRVGYMETVERQQTPGPNLLSAYGLKGIPEDPDVHGLPVFAISGLNSLGTTGPGQLTVAATGSGSPPVDKQGRNLQFLDNLSWVKGRHTFKFGVDAEQVTIYTNVTQAARPFFSFSGVYTQNPQSRALTGAAFADFLLGWVSEFTVSTPVRAEVRQHTLEAYVQDDWKLTPKLTVNLGLRYELAMPWYETAGHYANLILDAGNPAYGKVITSAQAGQYGYRDSFTAPDARNFAPRVGLAYLLTPKTVVRSGFGVFFGRVDENLGVSARLTNNPPYFLRTDSLADQIHKLITLGGGLPPNVLDPEHLQNLNANSWAVHMPLPYTLAWNLNVQRELGRGFTGQIGYVATGGHDLYYSDNVNQPYPGPGSAASRRPLPSYTTVLAYMPVIRSNYQSLIVQTERRFRRGFSFLAAYTWGHAIDNGGQVSDVGDAAPQNPFNLAAERGSSNYDVRQRLSISYIYEVPFGRGKPWLNQPGAARALLGGWQLSGITSIQTGLPFTPLLSFDPTNTGAPIRPDVVAGVPLYPAHQDPSEWFNPNAFKTPALYTFGNAGRDILRAPGAWNNDLGLLRSAWVLEKVNLQFSAQAFNLFNTPQLGLPNARVGVSTAGVISTVAAPQRQLQFGLHLRF
ncbi:MAG: TonB-dependent receptor [Bryobacteraceae bacterium]